MKKSILPFERILTFEESNLLKSFINKAVEIFERWGYNYLKLPAFDHYEVHREALGERVREVITFKEGENLIALRADFTAQVVRSVSFFKVWHYPLRVYYFGTLFSTEGDTYERFQVGVELIGVREIEGDAEVISAIHEYLRSLGIKNTTVSIGHVGIVKHLLSKVAEEQREVLREAFREKNLTVIGELLGRDKFSELPLLQGGREVLNALEDLGLKREKEELLRLGELLEEAGVCYTYDLSEVREFPYYTGVVFEVFHPDLGFPIAGGGRYDSLSELYGESFPATGGGIYVDQLLGFLKSEKEKKDYFVVDLTEGKKYGFKIASLLRSKGYKVGRDIVRRAYKHSIDYAFSEGYKKVVVIFDEEDVRVFTTATDYNLTTLKEFLELL